jgi:hypothetical protein
MRAIFFSARKAWSSLTTVNPATKNLRTGIKAKFVHEFFLDEWANGE